MAPRRRVRRRSVSRAPGRDCPGTHAAADDRWPVEPVAWAREPLGAERALRVARDPACEAQPSGGRAPGHGFGVQGAGPGSDQRSPGERRTAVARSRFTDRCRGTRCACCCMPPSRSPRTGTASTPRPTDRPGPCRRSRRRPAFTGRALVNSARDDRALCRPGDQAICRPADLPTKRYADLPTGRPADRALRRPGDPTARRSGGRAIGRRGSGDAARATRLGRQTRHPCPRLIAAPRRDPTRRGSLAVAAHRRGPPAGHRPGCRPAAREVSDQFQSRSGQYPRCHGGPEAAPWRCSSSWVGAGASVSHGNEA